MGSPNSSDNEEAEAEIEVEGDDTVLDKKAQKKLVKAQQAEKRKMKKQLKQAFTDQSLIQYAKSITEVGGIRQGVSVKKIY